VFMALSLRSFSRILPRPCYLLGNNHDQMKQAKERKTKRTKSMCVMPLESSEEMSVARKER
jgi:hypothetical protein